MMKKNLKNSLVLIVLCLILAASTACGANNLRTESPQTPSVEQTAPEQALDGVFALEGKTYQLPMPLKTLLDAGWQDGGGLSHNDVVQSFVAKSEGGDAYWSNCELVSLIKNEVGFVVICYNPTDAPVALEESMVFALYSFSDTDCVLPGGISLASDKQTVMEAYGVADEMEEFYGSATLMYGNLSKEFTATFAQQIYSSLLKERTDYSGVIFSFEPDDRGEVYMNSWLLVNARF